MSKNPQLRLTITMKDGSPVPVELLAEVLTNTVAALKEIEKAKTGLPEAHLRWTVTRVKEE